MNDYNKKYAIQVCIIVALHDRSGISTTVTWTVGSAAGSYW